MYILGFNGGFDLAHERRFVMGEDATHDASATLLHDGSVIAAVEEERLTRIKHCAKFPIESIKFCLNFAKIDITQIDHFAFFTEESFADYYLNLIYLNRPNLSGPSTYREFFRSIVGREFGVDVDVQRLHFVPHHIAHAASAHWASRMDESLVVVLDGQGENNSGLIARARGENIEVLDTLSVQQSLGYMYLSTIRLLGYWNGDEYKAMGLAPHGDPKRFRRIFGLCYALLPDGRYSVNEAAMTAALLRFCPPRRRGEPFTREHCDVAAGLQAALETIVLHVLAHYRRATGLRSLTLAGGVAHNCSLNGKIARSGLFDSLFVHPASYDPGCAMGAAQWVSMKQKVAPKQRGVRGYFLGGDATHDLSSRLQAWSPLVSYELSTDVEADTAVALAAGEIVGWVQGRSEFGPRALGARNILADARPASNRRRVNERIKKRESHRPFAPAIPIERAFEFFDLPDCAIDYDFMSFAVPVRWERRAELGAVTHIDGSARVQVVRREDNPRFWQLLNYFDALTGTPVLLSTSFNNDVEPMVENADDAIVCFLTTNLDRLIIGNHVIRRRPFSAENLTTFIPQLPPHIMLNARTQARPDTAAGEICFLSSTAKFSDEHRVSAEMYAFLRRCNGIDSIGNILDASPGELKCGSIVQELIEIWSKRLVILRPPDPSGNAFRSRTHVSRNGDLPQGLH